MGKFGINVPPGIPAFSIDDVARAADEMKDENNEVGDEEAVQYSSTMFSFAFRSDQASCLEP